MNVVVCGVADVGVVGFMSLDVVITEDAAFIIVADEVPGGLRLLAELRPYMPWHTGTGTVALTRGSARS